MIALVILVKNRYSFRFPFGRFGENGLEQRKSGLVEVRVEDRQGCV